MGVRLENLSLCQINIATTACGFKICEILNFALPSLLIICHKSKLSR